MFHTIFLWIFLLSKRLLQRKSFFCLLFLLPVMVLSLRFAFTEKDSTFRVGLYTPTNNPNTLEYQLVQELCKEANQMITYTCCNSIEEVKEGVMKEDFSCGYIFPDHLEEQLEHYHKKNTPLIQVFHGENSSYRIMDELIFGKIYHKLSFYILTAHMKEKTGFSQKDVLYEHRASYGISTDLFLFQHSDGSTNTFLSNQNQNFLLLPIRGIMAIFLLLAGIIGTGYWYQDEQKKLFSKFTYEKKQLLSLSYIMLPIFLISTVGFCAIYITQIKSSFLNELLCFSLYTFFLTTYCYFFKTLLPNVHCFFSYLFILVVGSLVACPIFINITDTTFVLQLLNRLTPVSYYLSSIYSPFYKTQMLLMGILFLGFGLGISAIKRKSNYLTLTK